MRKILNQNKSIKRNSKKCWTKKITSRKAGWKQQKMFKCAWNVFQQIRQGSYFICTVCHKCLYKHSVRLINHEKFYILKLDFHYGITWGNMRQVLWDNSLKHIISSWKCGLENRLTRKHEITWNQKHLILRSPYLMRQFWDQKRLNMHDISY